MKLHHKKMLAPIIISVILIFYYIFYFGFLIALVSGFWKYILGIIPTVLAILTIIICYERIKEIRSGEEDDLSKY